jgi:hypothetical protein
MPALLSLTFVGRSIVLEEASSFFPVEPLWTVQKNYQPFWNLGYEIWYRG